MKKYNAKIKANISLVLEIEVKEKNYKECKENALDKSINTEIYQLLTKLEQVTDVKLLERTNSELQEKEMKKELNLKKKWERVKEKCNENKKLPNIYTEDADDCKNKKNKETGLIGNCLPRYCPKFQEVGYIKEEIKCSCGGHVEIERDSYDAYRCQFCGAREYID